MGMDIARKKNCVRNDYLSHLDSLVVPNEGCDFGYVSVFCGGGGLDLGFSTAGFRPLFSSDLIPVFCETIHENLGSHIVEPHDIIELSGEKVKVAKFKNVISD